MPTDLAMAALSHGHTPHRAHQRLRVGTVQLISELQA